MEVFDLVIALAEALVEERPGGIVDTFTEERLSEIIGALGIFAHGLRCGQRQQLAGGLDNLFADFKLEVGIQHGANDLRAERIILGYATDICAEIALDLHAGRLGHFLSAPLNDCGGAHLTLWGKVDLLSGRSNKRARRDGVGINVSGGDAIEFSEHLHHFEGDIDPPAGGVHIEENHLYIVGDGLFEAPA